MKKMKFLASTLLISLIASCNGTINSGNSSSSTISSSSSNSIIINPINSIEITKDSTLVEELEVLVGDTFKLDAQLNDGLQSIIKWTSSNSEILSIDNQGNVNVNSDGKVVITAEVDGFPYINDELLVTCREKVEQLGVGSGLTKDDPIFLGNEGEDEPLEIRFIEMQKTYADSIFIKKGNVEILIDSGYESDGAFVKQIVEQYCPDNRLDMLMLSHSDGDHIDGLKNATSVIDDISLMIDYGGLGGSDTVKKTRSSVIENGGIYHSAYDCVNNIDGASNLYYLTEDFYVEILNTGNYITKNEASAGNGKSVAAIFHYKNFTFFTAGDLTTSSEADLLKNEDLPEVTLYKASHHGSNGSSSQELLDILNPQAVAISSAIQGNRGADGAPSPTNTTNLNAVAGHPYAGAIERIYKTPNISENLNVYWNGVNGTMKFTTFGSNDFTFEGSKTLKGYYDLTLTGGSPKWNEELKDFENRVTGEENYKFHETKAFEFRGYNQYLPAWAKQ